MCRLSTFVEKFHFSCLIVQLQKTTEVLKSCSKHVLLGVDGDPNNHLHTKELNKIHLDHLYPTLCFFFKL